MPPNSEINLERIQILGWSLNRETPITQETPHHVNPVPQTVDRAGLFYDENRSC